MADVLITCLLGVVSSPDMGVSIDAANAAANSTRWIFDVEHDTQTAQSFAFQLIDAKTGSIRSIGFTMPAITPLDADAAGALLHIPEPNLDTLRVTCENTGSTIHYRVSVDAIHSIVR